MNYRTEDEVRDGYTDKDGFHKGAKQILEFDKAESGTTKMILYNLVLTNLLYWFKVIIS